MPPVIAPVPVAFTMTQTVATADRPNRSSLLFYGAVGLWTVAFTVVCVRVALARHENDLFPTYQQAGNDWLHGQPLYRTHQGFIYTPPVAALFALLAPLPSGVGAAAWRLLNMTAFLTGALLWLRRASPGTPDRTQRALFLGLLFPISLGNLNNGQVNPLMISLLIGAVLCAQDGRWTLSALLIGIATYFKVYPLAVGLLLTLLYPRPLGWRLALTLVGIGLLPYLCQHPGYVTEQYGRWFQSRRTDLRRGNIDMAPRDLWMLTRALHLHLGGRVYAWFQAVSALALAGACWWGQRAGWSRSRLSHAVLLLGCAWMLLLGPSTESATYVLLAPLLAYACLRATEQGFRMRAVIYASYGVLVFGLALNSFLHVKRNVYLKSVQPLGAVLFVTYAGLWIFGDRWWQGAPPARQMADDKGQS